MSDLTLTLPATFADGNSMEAAHISVPTREIEDWVNGNVGHDGVGDNNWSATESLRGFNFRKNALKQVWRRGSDTDTWLVVPHATLTGGGSGGIEFSPLPNSAMRFYLRHDALWVAAFYTFRTVDHSALGAWPVNAWFDGTLLFSQPFDSTASAAPASSARGYMVNSFGVSVSAGWHTLKWTTGSTSSAPSIAIKETELVIVAAYR